jgi:uncharacterized protein DUF2752
MNGSVEAISPNEGRIPPRISSADGLRWSLAAIATLAGVFGAVILFAFEPGRSGFPYPTCLFHESTGLLCPGCGSLRALHQLLHGHFVAAFRCNALLVLSIPLLAWWALRRGVAAIGIRPYALRLRPRWLWSAGTLLILFGILRNLPYPPFSWFAPWQ